MVIGQLGMRGGMSGWMVVSGAIAKVDVGLVSKWRGRGKESRF